MTGAAMARRTGSGGVPEKGWSRRSMRQSDVEVTSTRTLEEVARVDRAEVAWDERLPADPGPASFGLIDMAVPTEGELRIRIPDEDVGVFDTVGGAADYVRRARAAAHRPAGAGPGPAQEESR